MKTHKIYITIIAFWIVVMHSLTLASTKSIIRQNPKTYMGVKFFSFSTSRPTKCRWECYLSRCHDVLSSFVLAQIHFKPYKHKTYIGAIFFSLFTSRSHKNTYHFASYIVVTGSLILALITSFNLSIPKTWVGARFFSIFHIKAPQCAHHIASLIVTMCSLTLASLKSINFNLPKPKIQNVASWMVSCFVNFPHQGPQNPHYKSYNVAMCSLPHSNPPKKLTYQNSNHKLGHWHAYSKCLLNSSSKPTWSTSHFLF